MKRRRAIEDARRDELPIGTHRPRRHSASTLAEFTDVLRPERPYRMSARNSEHATQIGMSFASSPRDPCAA
jgi:hypothetical protein